VFRGPHLICVSPRAGCADIFGKRSSEPLEGLAFEDRTGMKRDDLEDGESVGRTGVRDVIDLLEQAHDGY